MRHLDYPPVWLFAALGLAWAQVALFPVAPQPGPGWLRVAGTLVALAGGALAVLAAQNPAARLLGVPADLER